MNELSKLQIRAKVLEAVSRIKSEKLYNEDLLAEFVEELSQISDKKSLFDIFFKEFIKMEENEYIFSACLLKELVPVDYINEKALAELKNSSFSDEIKYKIVQLLRVAGSSTDYNSLPSYFDNPQEVLDKETKRLLETAVFNPESMLDFLDFVSAVKPSDRSLLLNSLKNDYKGDVLANIIYPVVYSDFNDEFVLQVVDILGDSKSSLAVKPFEYLLATSNNTEIINACKLGLKKLNLAGASKEKAEEYFKNIIKTSFPAEFYTTIPDGNANQALLISRVNTHRKYMIAAIVINDYSGIVDCFGFYNITEEELIKVLTKFYKSEGKYKVSPEYVKTRINYAVKKTISLKNKFPYEFVCWRPILSDINELEYSFEDYAQKNCVIQQISKEDVLNILTKDYSFRWFIAPSENTELRKIIDNLYSCDNPNIEYINNLLIENIDTVFDEETLNLWREKFYNLIYLLKQNSKNTDADKFYTILKNDEYFSTFKSVILQRSIFNHFGLVQQNLKDSVLPVNIFRKRNSIAQKYDYKKVSNIVNLLRKNWIYE